MALPGIEPDVVVIASGAQKRGGITHPLRHLEAEHTRIEGDGTIEIGHLQVHVPDFGAGIDWLGHGSMMAHERGGKSSVRRISRESGDSFADDDFAKRMTTWLRCSSSSLNRSWRRMDELFMARACGSEMRQTSLAGMVGVRSR